MNSATSTKNKVIAIFAVVAVMATAILAQLGGTLAAPADKIVTLQCESGVSELFQVEKGATTTIGISYLSDARCTDTDVATVAFTASVDGEASVTGVKAGLANLVYGNIAGKVGSFKFQITDSDNISGYTLKDGGEMSFEAPAGPGQGETKASPVVDVTGQADRITWTSLNEDVATVAANGDITAVGPGMTVVTGDFIDKWGVSRYIIVVVGVGGEPGGTGFKVTGVTVTPGGTVQIGRDGVGQFSAKVEGTGVVPQEVVWKIQHAYSEDAKISSDGLLQVWDRSKDEYVIIRATSVADPSVYKDVTVTLEDDYADPEFYLTLYGKTQMLVGSAVARYGYEQGFTAVDFATGADITQEVTWKLYNNESASTTIGSDGLLSVAAGETATNVVIGVTNDSGVSRYQRVFFLADDTPDFTVTSITITPEETVLSRDGYALFSATVNGTGDVPQEVIWSIENVESGNVSISSNGLVEARSIISLVDPKYKYLVVRATSVANPSVSEFGLVDLNVVYIPEPLFYFNIDGEDQYNKGPIEMSLDSTHQVSIVLWNSWISIPAVWKIIENQSASTTISASGLLTIAADETAPYIVLQATYQSGYTEVRHVKINILP